MNSAWDGFKARVFALRIKRLYTEIGVKIWDKNVEIPPRLWVTTAKKVKSKEDVSQNTKNEKNKRQQAFQNSWKQGRAWLVFDDKCDVLPVCKEAAAVDVTVSHKNSFISRNCQFKLESIKLHKD